MGRASRRKRANGGTGFYRREHLLAAAEERADVGRAAGGTSTAVPDESERSQETPGRARGAAEVDITYGAPDMRD